MKHVWLHCESCSEPFLVKRSQQNRLKNCSYACKGKSKTAKHSVSMTCAQCAREFLLPPSSRKNHDKAFCSPSCSSTYNANHREDASVWKQGVDGYVFINCKGRKIFQHRVVMENTLGRELKDHENVHHINGDRGDNRPANLELWSRHQPYGQRVSDKLEYAKEIFSQYGIVARPCDSSFVNGLLSC